MANFGRVKTWGSEVLQPTDLNAEFDNIINNITSGSVDADNIDLTDVYAWTGAHSFSAATTHTNTVTVGVDDTGHDVKFFGATSGAHLLWDESADTLKMVGGAKINAQGTVTVGVDDTGYDVQFFGATAGAHMLWDESADDLKLVGAAGLTVAGLAALTTATISSTSTISGDMTFNDNVKLTLGTGGDVDFYFDGTNTILNTQVVGTGYLSIPNGNMGLGIAPTVPFHVSVAAAGGFNAIIDNSSGSDSNVLNLDLSAVSPDNNTHRFLSCSDSTTDRCIIWTDGDLANHDGTYGTISDVKFKQDIVDARGYWDDFKSLQYRKFRHKSDVEADANASYRLGLIAQEVETIFPALVPESPGSDGVSYKWVKSSIIEGPIMASVVQELMARVEALEAV